VTARKFLCVCASSFLLATSSGNAQDVTLYTVEYDERFVDFPSPYTLGTYGPYQAPQNPSALVFGHLPLPGASASEVVVEQHVLNAGESVPLPNYADGTVASENEVFWTVHLWRARFGNAAGGVNGRHDTYYPATLTTPGDVVRAHFTGLTYDGGSGLLSPFVFPSNLATRVDVMVTVVAVRSAVPTSTRGTSWGQVKARYAPKSTPAPGTPTDR
jgi:hypothetical protein